jgi:ubiquinone/menaquinone biosynthesis C-methylase UbiE
MTTHRRFHAAYLVEAGESPDVRALKAQSYELLVVDPRGSYLDIGCGPGIDTVALAGRLSGIGSVIGIDADPEQVRAAEQRAASKGLGERVRHMAGTADHLPFGDASFSGCRCERLLQHLTPQLALQAFAEARRVAKKGGRLVFIDTDWPSFSIHTAHPALERRLTSWHLATIANPYAARGLADLFISHGMTEVRASSTVVHLGAQSVRRLLADAAVMLAAQGGSTPPLFDAWCAELQRLEQGGRLYATVNMVCCSGNTPGGSGERAA